MVPPNHPSLFSNPLIIVAFIAGVFGCIQVILKIFLPHLRIFGFLRRTKKRDTIEGKWKSSWGPYDERVLKHHETLDIYKQKGCDIWARATNTEEPGKEWEVRGRFENKYLQLIYYPSINSSHMNFIDYGCYFVEQKTNGDFEGFSVGFGKNDNGTGEGMFTDYHYLESPFKF